MEKDEMIELWNEMLYSEDVFKKFTQMVIGRHDNVGDGWRTLTLKDVKITLERTPVGFLIYTDKHRHNLGKDDKYEQMCIDFDKLIVDKYKTALQKHRETWGDKSDEWLFERLNNELKSKIEEIHRLLHENEMINSQNQSLNDKISENEKEFNIIEKYSKEALFNIKGNNHYSAMDNISLILHRLANKSDNKAENKDNTNTPEEASIITDRLVSDYTFATRFKNFLKDIKVNDMGSEEELEYMRVVAKKLLEFQIDTAEEENEINYLKRCHNIGGNDNTSSEPVFNYRCLKCGSKYTNLKKELDYSNCVVSKPITHEKCNGQLVRF